MKKLLIIAMACYGLSARAQLRESRDFLYLYSDSVIYANDIKFRPDFAGNLRVKVDSRNVPIAQVKFLNTKDGFFANTRKMGVMRTEAFAERIIAGKINVFLEKSLSYVPFIYNPHNAYELPYAAMPVTAINSNMYYNKGYSDLKKLNYTNLKRDLRDDPRSMDMLRAYRRSVNTTTLCYIAGAASLLTGLFVATSEGKNAFSDKNFIIGSSLGVLGLGLVTGGYFKTFSAKKKLENTIDIYNR
ncbi:hypothetical protein [Pedobacter sp. MC2016-24]|uniref:hypothetical protein n=1 Tax=Pedobacter sp. MC2016-24 TaxID=2780090 RepID=UPI0018818111|nr:hypothetical protein [Pedobacter sp. MC2016-24]MBE9597887.1 hypothetical protein [Pedobacter sp. MC2016-24]